MDLILKHGAVSEPVARAMAAGALAASRADMAVAITGIAGPGGGSTGKPVGLVHFGLAMRDGAVRHLERRYGDLGRAGIRRAAVADALSLLEEASTLTTGGTAMDRVTTRLCIVGGGPRRDDGRLLFARAGIDTIVLEKHADFLRDFRGDTIHPSTLDLMDELGFTERFRPCPSGASSIFPGSSPGAATGRGFQPAADPQPLPVLHAAMGFLGLLGRRGRALSGLPPDPPQ